MTWLVVPEQPLVACLAHLPDIPGVDMQRVTLNKVPVTLVRHDFPTWKALYAAGLRPPSPARRYQYPGRFPPRESQQRTVEFLVEHRKAFVTSSMGVGKTLAAVWAADYLMQQGAVRRVLVVAPRSILRNVWEKELFQTLPRRAAVVLEGDRTRKQRMAADERFEFIIVNPESLHLIEGHLPGVDLVIVDEFTKFKNPTTRRWKALSRITQQTRLWLMSGTPSPQSPLDALGPIKLVRKERLTKREWQWMTMYQVSQFRWLPKPDAEQSIARWMQPSIGYRLEECVDIPPITVQELEVELTPRQKALIDKLRKEALAELGDGREITAANAAAVLFKVLQVMGGSVYGDDAGQRFVEAVDAGPLMEALIDLVEGADSPVVVFVPFRSVAENIHSHMEAAKLRSALVMGGVKGREAVFDAFRRKELDVLVAVAGTMSHGVDGLQDAGRYVVWALPPFSFEEYEQANARLHRGGQTRQVVVYHIIQNKISKQLFDILQSKDRLQKAVLNLLRGVA